MIVRIFAALCAVLICLCACLGQDSKSSAATYAPDAFGEVLAIRITDIEMGASAKAAINQ